MNTIIKCIPKKYKSDVILFFPEYETTYGTIMSYMEIGQHSEASLDFYYSICKPCKNNEAQETMTRYSNHYDCILKVVKRRF